MVEGLDISLVAQKFNKQTTAAQPEKPEEKPENNEGTPPTEVPVEEKPEGAEKPEGGLPPEEAPSFETDLETYKSKIADLEKKLADKKPEYANEWIQKMDELAKNGVNITSGDFFKMQQFDSSKYDVSTRDDAMELRRLELEVTRPELSPEQINWVIKNENKDLFDDGISPDDQEYKDAMMGLTIKATESKRILDDFKKKVTVPKMSTEERQALEQQERQRERQILEDVDRAVGAYESESFKVGDVDVQFSVDDKTKDELKSQMLKIDEFWINNFSDPDPADPKGERRIPKLKELRRAMLILKDFDKISKVMVDQGISIGREQIAAELENSKPQGTQESKPQGESKPEALKQAIANHVQKKFFG